MRSLILAVLLSTLSLAARADEWTHNYAVSGKPQLIVDANDADVEISLGSSQQIEAQ